MLTFQDSYFKFLNHLKQPLAWAKSLTENRQDVYDYDYDGDECCDDDDDDDHDGDDENLLKA